MTVMREVIYVEKSAVTQNGKSVLEEIRCHGLLGEDGSFRLLGYCGKRFPGQEIKAQLIAPAKKTNKAA